MKCRVCNVSGVSKYGMVIRHIYTREGKQKRMIQKYLCPEGHLTSKLLPTFDDSFIEHVVFIYLHCLSLNTTITLIREQYDTDVLTKGSILTFIESVADALPSIDDIDGIYHPTRSGYLALDGVWFSYGQEEIVLIVAFDPESFDIVGAIWADDETQEGYETVLTQAVNKIGAVNMKGLYADGDNGFLAAWKKLLPTVPFQLCVFHKELRMGQVVPVKRVSTSKQMTDREKHDIKVFQLLFREVIYAYDKSSSITALERLKAYVKSNSHSYPEKFQKAYRSLIHNFSYTLTHFDHPHMRRDNNLLECFNGCMKPRLRLMRGFKKKANLDRYLKLFLLDHRFHELTESRFKARRGKTPLEIAGATIPVYRNFLRLLREELQLDYQPKNQPF